MRRITLIALAATLLLTTVGVGAASAGEGPPPWPDAWVNHWETDYHGYNDWWNPCLGTDVVIESTVHVKGTFILDPWGVDHGTDHSKLVEGVDDQGWIATQMTINRSFSGNRDLSDGGYWMWQMHVTMENPETGQQYKALFTSRIVVNANGEVVMTTDPWGSTSHNTCIG